MLNSDALKYEVTLDLVWVPDYGNSSSLAASKLAASLSQEVIIKKTYNINE